MSFDRFLCKNDITDLLRKMYKANPVLIPESGIKPLMLVARRGKKTENRGLLKNYLAGAPELNIKPNESIMSDSSLSRSSTVSFGLGLKIMDGFLKGLGASSAPVSTHLKGVKDISFSFMSPKRFSMDIGELGNVIKGKKLDFDHPAIGIFTEIDDPYDMLLISGTIVSNRFAINIEKAKEAEFEASIPVFQQGIADLDTNLKVEVKNNRTITFEGAEELTFAFTTVLMEFDPKEGTLKLRESVLMKDGKEVEVSPYEMLDNNEEEPGMLIWD